MLPGPQIPQAGTVSFPARGHHHSTKEQYQMQREVASANERIASAEAFLQPHIRAEYVCGWHERMRRKVEENAAASEAAGKKAAHKRLVTLKRVKLEALYAEDVRGWTSELDPARERDAATKKRVERAVQAAKDRDERHAEAVEAARVHVENHRRANMPEFREAAQLAEAAALQEERVKTAEGTREARAAAASAEKRVPDGRAFEPEEDVQPFLDVAVGFADDGARTLSSAAKRRAFVGSLKGVLEGLCAATVEARGLDVKVVGKAPQLVASVRVSAPSRDGLAGAVDAWRAAAEAKALQCRNVPCAWVDAPKLPAMLATPRDAGEAASRYRDSLASAVADKAARRETEAVAAADEDASLAQIADAVAAKREAEQLAAVAAARDRFEALVRDAEWAKSRKAADAAAEAALDAEALEALKLDDARDDDARCARDAAEKAAAALHKGALRRQAARERADRLEEFTADVAEEPSFAGLAWADHASAAAREAFLSRRLRDDVQAGWDRDLERREETAAEDRKRREAEQEVRDRLWAQHRAREAHARDEARRASAAVASENLELLAEKRGRAADARDAAVRADLRALEDRDARLRALAPDVPPNLAHKLPPSMRPATADAKQLRDARLYAHNAVAAGRPRTASAVHARNSSLRAGLIG